MSGAAILAAMAMTVSAAPAPEVEEEPINIQISRESAEACNTQGGCAVVTREAMEGLLRKAAQEGYAKGLREAETSCRRNSI